MPMQKPMWQVVTAAVVGGAAAFLLLAFTPVSQHQMQYVTTTGRMVQTMSTMAPAGRPQAINVDIAALQGLPANSLASELPQNVAATATLAKAPLLLVASGVLMAIAAAAVRLLRSPDNRVAQPAPYTMLMSAGRVDRERLEREREAAKQREVQERLARLAGLGLLPQDHPISAPVSKAPVAVAPASAVSSQRRPSENDRELARQREVQERLARLARNGFSVPSTVATKVSKAPPANLTMHVYDHCPYCIRVELFLGWNGVKYNRVVYGYGDMDGPKALIGKKMLPILTGDGAPYPAGMRGMPESLDMINWLSKDFGLSVAPASGRKDYSDWQKKSKNTIAGLMRPRLLKMPFRDFQTKEDVDYATAKWAKKGFNVEQAWASTPQLLVEMEALLRDLEPMIKGDGSLNPGGYSMDDIFLLPDLRRLTVVRDLKWPPKVRNYVDKALNYPTMQCVPYTTWSF